MLEIDGRYTIPDRKTIMITDQSDLVNLADKCGDCAPGSIAYTADMSYIAMLDQNGNWVQM